VLSTASKAKVANQIDGRYEIRMQSGDTIAVRATGCELEVMRVAV
jgi:translation initiation factor IF-1